jgi:hypothetical protein
MQYGIWCVNCAEWIQGVFGPITYGNLADAAAALLGYQQNDPSSQYIIKVVR